MKKYRELTPEERWEITDNLTPQDIMNGEVDHYLNDNVFWREVDYEHPDLVSFLDNRYAIINKEYGLEKLHKLSQYPRKKWEQIIAWYNHENNQNTNENKNMKQNKIKITENELKQIVAESVRKILSEARKPSDKTVGKHTLKGLRYDKNGNPLYTSDTMSDDEKKNQGWKFSKKHGMYGQLSDPTKLSESSTDINESRKKREPRKGTIELNGKHIDAVEDGLDKYGNPMYKVNDPSIKGRRCKDGSIRVQHYNFKPNRVDEGKTINNKSFFSRGGRNMKPGESLSGSYLEGNEFLRQKGYKNFHDAYAAVRRGELDKNTFDKWYDEHMKAVNKHNDRLEYNWAEGNYDDYSNNTLATSDYEDNY